MKSHYVAALVVIAALALFAQGDHVPAHHESAPPKGEKLPAILPREVLWGPNFANPAQVHAYELAAKIPNVLYQQPCYCMCEREGHTSLRTCFETTHGARCSTCMKEMYYSYLMTKKGKTPAQIRQGIVKGEWEQIELQTAASIN